MNGFNRDRGSARALKRTLTQAAFLAGLTLTGVPLTAAAQVQGTQAPPATIAQLTQAKKDLGRVAGNTKGSHRQLLQMEQVKIQGVIDDLQSGKQVDPAAIDKLLQNADRDAR
jgi:hypothetical protein